MGSQDAGSVSAGGDCGGERARTSTVEQLLSSTGSRSFVAMSGPGVPVFAEAPAS